MENWTIKCFCPVNSWIVINPLQHWVMRVPGGYFGPPLLHQGCFKSQKNNAIFASFARAVLFALWETGSSIFSLPVLPLSPPTHIWAIQHSAQTQTAHASHTGKTQPVLQHADPTQVTHCHMHTHTHTYTHMRGLLAVSPAVEIGQPTPALVSVVLQSQSALHFLLRLTFLLRRALINILHGFYMDLFSFLLLSPRGAMATFSCLFNDCGWTINNLHTSKHSTTPTRCCRLNSQSDGKDMFSKKKKKKKPQKKNKKLKLEGGLDKTPRVACEHVGVLELTTAKQRILTWCLLQVVEVDVDYFRSRSCERSAWLVCSLPQTACQWDRER